MRTKHVSTAATAFVMVCRSTGMARQEPDAGADKGPRFLYGSAAPPSPSALSYLWLRNTGGHKLVLAGGAVEEQQPAHPHLCALRDRTDAL